MIWTKNRERVSTSYTYDANGNELTKTSGSSTISYAWDFENRLTSVTSSATGVLATFQYDPFGRRVQKVAGGVTTNYAYDGDSIVEELNASGTATARYAQGLGIDEPLARNASGVTYFYDADGLGSITSITDTTGAIADSNIYDSFGSPYYTTGTVPNPFKFTARELDTETGLYYYRARYYDQSVGRFLSEDPIRMGGGVDFYTYVRNNPVVRNDPTGLIHQAWNEPPGDGRLHDDTTGLEVLCTNPKTLARDIEWLEHSILVRSAEIDSLGKNADVDHIVRRDAEEATLARCTQCRDRDKKPENNHDPSWEAVKDSARKLGNEILDYCSKHPITCVAIGLGIGSIGTSIPVPVPE